VWKTPTLAKQINPFSKYLAMRRNVHKHVYNCEIKVFTAYLTTKLMLMDGSETLILKRKCIKTCITSTSLSQRKWCRVGVG
jgi:hypothetical protein